MPGKLPGHCRRLCHVTLTSAGQRLIDAIRADGVRQERAVLEQIDGASRGDVVRALELVAETLVS